MILDIKDIDSPRFVTAVELLGSDGGFRLDGVEFTINDDCLQCRVQSSWNPENLTDDFALRDFERAKRTFDALTSQSTEFTGIVDGLSRRFSLIDDYGMGAVELAHFEKGNVKWTAVPAAIHHDIPKLLDYLFENGFQMRDATIGTMHSYSVSFLGPQTLTITCDRGQLILGGEQTLLEPHGLWRAFDSIVEFQESVIQYLSRN